MRVGSASEHAGVLEIDGTAGTAAAVLPADEQVGACLRHHRVSSAALGLWEVGFEPETLSRLQPKLALTWRLSLPEVRVRGNG